MGKRQFLEVRPEPARHTFLGLSTQLRDYRLSFLLNKIPGFQFSRTEDLPVLLPGLEEPVPFSIYSCAGEEGFNTFTLISNRSGEQFLIPQLRQSDYLLLIEGPLKKPRKEELLKSLRLIPGMLLATELNQANGRFFETLVADLEMHKLKNKRNTPATQPKEGGIYV